jgi:hypothetical protein
MYFLSAPRSGECPQIESTAEMLYRRRLNSWCKSTVSAAVTTPLVCGGCPRTSGGNGTRIHASAQMTAATAIGHWPCHPGSFTPTLVLTLILDEAGGAEVLGSLPIWADSCSWVDVRLARGCSVNPLCRVRDLWTNSSAHMPSNHVASVAFHQRGNPLHQASRSLRIR